MVFRHGGEYISFVCVLSDILGCFATCVWTVQLIQLMHHVYTNPQDNDSFQAKFNALIELNQANRGNLVRSPTREKLIVFLEKLSSHQNHHELDPTALWYFLTIHDSILHPLVGFLKFKAQTEDREAVAAAVAAAAALSVVMQDPADTDKNKRPASEQEEEDNFKRSKLVERS